MNNFSTKKQIAADRLRHEIRIGRYAPGSPLKQNDIATDLGLSSTPVREALADLATSGLVVYEQHRGTRVSTLDVERVEQAYEARRILEKESAKLSFKHLTKTDVQELQRLQNQMTAQFKAADYETLLITDAAFHHRIYEASENPYLTSAIEHLLNSFPRYFMWNIGGRIKQSMREHREMLAALKNGDRTRFIHAVTDHLDHSLMTIRDHVDEVLGNRVGAKNER